jgi:hypothetical protein
VPLRVAAPDRPRPAGTRDLQITVAVNEKGFVVIQTTPGKLLDVVAVYTASEG